MGLFLIFRNHYYDAYASFVVVVVGVGSRVEMLKYFRLRG